MAAERGRLVVTLQFPPLAFLGAGGSNSGFPPAPLTPALLSHPSPWGTHTLVPAVAPPGLRCLCSSTWGPWRLMTEGNKGLLNQRAWLTLRSPPPPLVMLAEIVKHFHPRLVDLHNYVPTCNTDQKLSNWSILNRQALRLSAFSCWSPPSCS